MYRILLRTIGKALLGILSILPTAAWALTPNDPYYNDSRNLEYYGPMLHMPAAWDLSMGSPTVTVAVLDTGVLTNTPDLAGRILPALSAVPGEDPATDAWMRDTSQTPLRRHGTWVASVAAMGVNNGIGGAGVGNFSILPIRITNDSVESDTSWAAAAIRIAADKGARVINLSYEFEDYSAIEAAATYARSLGSLTFISAGNTNGYRDLEDQYPNLIFVAGTDKNDQRWRNEWDDSSQKYIGSSWGPYVDLSAPAEKDLVADPTLQPNGYGIISGTSFATPLAAGAAALAWSINPELSANQVQDMLFSTALDLGDPGRDDVFGEGRLDIGAVTQAAWATVPEPSTYVLLSLAAIVFLARFKKLDPGSRRVAVPDA
jgi:thermitase